MGRLRRSLPSELYSIRRKAVLTVCLFFAFYFRAERSVKELKEKFLQGKIPDLVKTVVLNKHDPF